MKVYKFFKIPDDDDSREYELEDKYVLYAITNNKKYAERFKEDRNMKRFIYKVYDDVSKEEYADICNNDNNRGAVLEVHKLTTIFNNHTRANRVEKEVLMTNWEKQIVNEPSTLLDDERAWQMMPFPLIFKSKYRKMLEVLQYITFYKLMTADFISPNLMEKISEIDDDYSAPSIEFDEVAIFIDQIQSTL